jgi:hypothetical protein
MVELKGKFLGMARYMGGEEFLVFENVTEFKGACNYFGAQWRVLTFSDGSPSIYLRSTHYGNSIETLKPAGTVHIEKNIEFKEAKE